MNLKDRPLTAEFLAAFFLVGVPHWLTPYNKTSTAGVIIGGLIIAAVAAVARLRIPAARFSGITRAAALAMPAAALARVIVETTMVDPTSHNLWPFEITAALLLGYAGAIPGALMGVLIGRYGNKR